MRILAAADRLVVRTGLYRMTMIDRPRPRSLRWLPILVLAALWVGLALLPTRPGIGLSPIGFVGALLFLGGYCTSIYLRFFGPRLDSSSKNPLDERERALRARAFAWSGAVFTLVACFGCLYMGLAEALGWPRPSGIQEWINLGMALQATSQILPVFFASWLQPVAPALDDVE